VEAAANDYIRRIDDMGGMLAAVESGFPQREIARAAYEYQRSVEQGESAIVGVNKFTDSAGQPIEVLQIGEEAQKRQIEALHQLKKRRSQSAVDRALHGVRKAAEGAVNTMPPILDAVRAYATVGEICGALKDAFGGYTETSVI
jgi:methylmalonyl-CoA mutase N-terminal domain/subunit